MRDRAEISPAGRCPPSASLRQVLTRSAEHLHDAERGFLSRFQSNVGPKIFDFFRCRKNFHPRSCEMAQKSARPDDGRPARHSNRSSQDPPSTGTTRRAGFVAISIAFRTENFRFFSVPQKFSSQIVRDRARISAAGRQPTSAALRQMLTRSAEH